MAIRLSKDAWAAIRQAYMGGATARELAPRYGVTAGAIRKKSCEQGWSKISLPAEIRPILEPLSGLSESINRLAAAIETMTGKEPA